MSESDKSIGGSFQSLESTSSQSENSFQNSISYDDTSDDFVKETFPLMTHFRRSLNHYRNDNNNNPGGFCCIMTILVILICFIVLFIVALILIFLCYMFDLYPFEQQS